MPSSARLLLLFVALQGLCASAFPHVPPTVVAARSKIIGTTTMVPSATAVVNQFLGVRFAQPVRRLQPPLPVIPREEVVDATVRGASCIQQFNLPIATQEFTEIVFDNPPPASQSEDCLFLNIFTPSSPSPIGGRPVMFWIYGGAFEFGYGGLHTYDGSFFAAFEDIIVVTINYRTNVFGFPGSEQLPLTEQNLGFLDQRLALQWVHDNIVFFGGDPNKVTIAGESAGAESVDALITSLPHTTLFQAAILESGQIRIPSILETAPVADPFAALAAALKCPGRVSDLDCVLGASVSSILTIIETVPLIFNPVIDNVTRVGDAVARVAAGQFAQVPVLTGTNLDEATAFVQGDTNFTAFANDLFPPAIAAEVIAAYPLGHNGLEVPFDQVVASFTDFSFKCPAQLLVNQTVSFNLPTFTYLYSVTFPNLQPLLAEGINLEVYHSSEIPLVFGTFPTAAETAQEVTLSAYMLSAWASFIRNPIKGPGWTAVGAFPEDIAVLGLDGSSGATMMLRSNFTSLCSIYLPIYAAIS